MADRNRRKKAEEALQTLEDIGWKIRDYDVRESGQNGTKLDVSVYTYEPAETDTDADDTEVCDG